MSYSALYRKWRPNSFESIVGQEPIIRTLCNQIETGRIAHAYIFSGTRGTGKTSTAKVFARAINCTSETESKPCNQCPNCVSTLEDSNMDVIEMDAASNNGVEDIRDLRDNVKYPPANGNYKVYIIDEVHMLSKGAFNALLKTLEEPPEYVVFILATTEPHKIPPTIHSRCQRFDFKRVTYSAVRGVLEHICSSEGRDYEPAALDLIVQASEGAMRDALSIMDRCFSFDEGILTHAGVLSIMGISGDRLMLQIFNDLADRNIQGLLKSIQWAVDEGKDLQYVVKELVEFSRKLMLVRVSGDGSALLDISSELKDEIQTVAHKVPLETILTWITVFSQLESETRWTPHPRALLEKTLVQLVVGSPKVENTSKSESIGLVERIERIEAAIASAGSVRQRDHSPLAGGLRSRSSESSGKVNNEQAMPTKEVTGPVGFDHFQNQWSEVLAALKKVRIATYALLVEGKLSAWDEPFLTIEFGEKFEFHRIALEKEENRATVEGVVRQVTGKTVRLRCSTAGTVAEAQDNPDWIEDVQAFFAGHEDKIEIKSQKEDF